MRRTNTIPQAILWAAAIAGSALAGASAFVSIVLLPSLAVIALLVSRPRRCVAHPRAS